MDLIEDFAECEFAGGPTLRELRSSVCSAGAEGVRELHGDALMFLLSEALFPQDIEELFAELYRRYRIRVNVWCRRFMKDPDRAEDMTQEVFMRAFRYRRSFRGDARTSTWLYSIARNYCLTAIRKASADPSTGAADLDPRLRGSSGLETLRQMERDEEFGAVWRLLHRTLTPTEARVMVLHYGNSLPLAEITRKLALSNPSGAKGYIVNAKRKMGLVLARVRSNRAGSVRKTQGTIAA